MNILVADGDTVDRHFLTELLEPLGHVVTAVPTAEEALADARRHAPDLLVTDVYMPEMDGYLLCIEWRSDPTLCVVPFVFYTALHTNKADRDFALRLGADDLLTKLQDPDKLAGAIQAILDRDGHRALRHPLPDDEKMALLRGYGKRVVSRLERKLAELAVTNSLLRESNDTLTALVQGSPLGVALIGDDCAVRLWNPAAERIFGWTAEEVIGIRDPLFAPDADGSCPSLEAVRSGRFDDQVSLQLTRKDGSPLDLDVSAAAISAPDGALQGFIALFRDTTGKRESEEALKRSVERLERAMDGSIHVISKIIERRDPYTAGHEERVAGLAAAIAVRMGLPETRVDEIHTAGVVHDLGKIAVPSEILTKPGRLTEPEWSMIKVHPTVAHEILSVVDFDWPIAEICRQHHERMDGSGYPQGLKGDEILLEARILAVADVVEAMSSHRPYRPALGIEQALAEISEGRGTLYDADVVDACVSVFADGSFSL